MNTCPVCKGSGRLEEAPRGPVRGKRKEPQTYDKERMVKILIDAGYSYRQVMKLLNYKSTRSIGVLYHRKENS